MFMTIGPQGAGKDYQIANHPRLSKLICLTPDDLVVGPWNPKKWKVVYKFVNKTFKLLLSEGEQFVLNDVFTHPSKRKWYIKKAKKKGYLVVAFFLDVALETCLARNKKRGYRGHYGLVPDDVIATFYSEYRQHTPRDNYEAILYEEGFDHIMTVRC
jgi:predicted kinase